MSNGQAIQLSHGGNPAEPFALINPNNTQQRIIGANLNQFFLSTQSGSHWSNDFLESEYGVWGDPCIVMDTAGTLHYFHLSNPPKGNWIDRIVVQRSYDFGKTWTDGNFVGYSKDKQQDKEWAIYDVQRGVIHLTWTEFDFYGSSVPSNRSRIKYSQTLDGGISWSNPKTISTQDGTSALGDSTLSGSKPCLSTQGTLHVIWVSADGIQHTKSVDGGTTWSAETNIHGLVGGWAFDLPGIHHGNAFPTLVCDQSNGQHRGRLYLGWCDQSNGKDNTDLFLSHSDDDGITWSSPKMINLDSTLTHQFFPAFSVDPITGSLYVLYYDRSRFADETTEVVMGVSRNGGQSFVFKTLSDAPFFPNSQAFFGEYISIDAYDDAVLPAWTQLDQGQLSVWTYRNPLQSSLSEEEFTNRSAGVVAYPNPASATAYLSFALRRTSEVRIELLNTSGQHIQTLPLAKNWNYGKHIVPIDFSEMDVPAGSYHLQLYIDGELTQSQTVVYAPSAR